MQKKLIVTASIIMVGIVALMGVGRAFADDNQGEDQGDNQQMASTTMAHEGDQGENRINFGQMVKEFGQVVRGEDVNPQSADPSLAIDRDGKFRATGVTFNSVDTTGNTVNVSLYGFTKTVNVSGASLMGGATTMNLSDIKVGDKLSVMGTFNVSTGAISAMSINDVTFMQQNTANVQSRIQQLMQLVLQLQAQLKALGGH